MDKGLGADRALVASDQAATRLAPTGGDHGEDKTCSCFARSPWECACGAWDDVDLSLYDDDDY